MIAFDPGRTRRVAFALGLVLSWSTAASGDSLLQSTPSPRASEGGGYRLDALLRGALSGGVFRLTGTASELSFDVEIFSDGFETGDTTAWSPPNGMPTGAVALFWSPTCPPGWIPLATTRGRALSGVPSGGTPSWPVGGPLGDLEARHHQHAIDTSLPLTPAGVHTHRWATLDSQLNWRTYAADAGVIWLVQWTDGIGNEGSGTYPLASAPATSYYTQSSGSHLHELDLNQYVGTQNGALPYLQLLACAKI